jgi:predicted exporter
VLLWLRLRSWRRLWRIAQPIVAAVLIVLAVMSAWGVALGILHLVGLLLTVAIGSNYALFFDQIRNQQDQQMAASDYATPVAIDNDTLASLALANLTAVISFCLLAFSNIPALFSIGQVVAPGILLSLLLSAAFIPARGHWRAHRPRQPV